MYFLFTPHHWSPRSKLLATLTSFITMAQEILYKTCLHNSVGIALADRPGWEETDSDTDWDL